MKTPARQFTSVRERLRARRAAHQRQVRLERELAGYDTPAARHELDAILSRYPAEQTREIERILVKQAVRQPNLTRPPR
ncbi:MAG: hypothetical protein ABIM89_05865 [Mycobacteriales bacterium]